MFSVKREKLADWQDQAFPLMIEHQAERHVEVGAQPKPDFKLLLKLEECQTLMFWAARKESELIGYIIWTGCRTNAEYAGLATATQGPWFVKKTERASPAGLKLLGQSLRDLKEMGFKLAEPHHWNEPRLGKLFERLGAKQTITNYLLNLEDI